MKWNANTSNGGCNHTCTNSVGSYTCFCNDGYELNFDDHACDGMIWIDKLMKITNGQMNDAYLNMDEWMDQWINGSMDHLMNELMVFGVIIIY